MQTLENQRPFYLRNLPLFGGVSLDACGLLARCSEMIRLGDGGVLYEAGDRADAVFIVYDGCVQLEHCGALLNQLSAGSHVGVLELFDMERRGFTARAAGPCVVLRMPFEAFEELRKFDLKAFALVAMNAARQMSRRLRDADAERTQLLLRLSELEPSS